MIGRILWEGCANGRSACSAGSLCKRASWKGCKPRTCGFWAKKNFTITPERGTADFPPEWPSGAQDLVLPWRTPGCPGEEEEEERRGCTNRLTPRPGRAAQQPVPKLQNKSFPGTQPRGRSANESSAEPPLPSRKPPAPAGGCTGNLLGFFFGGKRGWLGSGGCSFHLEGLGWDEPSPGSERGGRNVASLHGGRSSPASLRVSGPLVKGV